MGSAEMPAEAKIEGKHAPNPSRGLTLLTPPPIVLEASPFPRESRAPGTKTPGPRVIVHSDEEGYTL